MIGEIKTLRYLLFAGAVLSVIPVVILFFFCRRLFVEGMMQGGIKG